MSREKTESEWQLRMSNSDESAEAKHLHRVLREEIEHDVGPSNRQALCLSFHDEHGRLCAGLRGFSHWSWLYISHLWVGEGERDAGLGSRLLAEAEREARKRSCVGLYVDTFTARAKAFYERNGFREHGRLDDFPPGHRRYFLEKRLVHLR